MKKKTVQPDIPAPADPPAPAEVPATPAAVAPVEAAAVALEGEQKMEKEPRRGLSRLIVALLIGIPVVLLLLVGAYFLSGFIVAGQIEKNYAAGDCAKVVSMGRTAQSIYPPAILPYVAPALTQFSECQPFVQAVDAQNQGNWETAYAGFAGYLASYPQGIVAARSRDGAAAVLYSWAEQMEEQKDFATAEEKLSLLLSDYGDNPNAGDARECMGRVLLEWAKSLQSSQDYTNSADKLGTILQLYGETSSAEEAKALLPHVYLEWGNDDLAGGDFTSAMGRFASAEQYADEALKIEIAAAKVHGQLAWVRLLSSNEEFNSSLAHLDTAEALASNDASASEVADLRTQVLEAFSNSDGTEARKFMQDATRTLCTNRKPAKLPILGINSDQVRIFSDTLNIPNVMVATTPGNLHFVTCVSDHAITIESCPYQHAHTVLRQRLDRTLELVDATTGRTYASKSFTGSMPATCQHTEWFTGPILYKTGAPPSDALLIGWLAQFTR